MAIAVASPSLAEDMLELPSMAELGLGGAADELQAWELLRSEKPIAARRAAEQILRRQPRSYLAHFVLALVLHYSEADFPRSSWHTEQALRSYEQRHGRTPSPQDPWQWHARILREQAMVTGELENHAQKLAAMQRYNELYEPDMVAERAWSLMKLRRYDAARRAAQEGLATGDTMQMSIALNALCAIEFEAGDNRLSYEACRQALEHAGRLHGEANAVDLTNFAEASRSVFQLAEAETTLLRAAQAPLAWYGNPWLELAELYTREARFGEALDALQRIHPYRQRRPAHVRNADLNEAKRALAAFLLVVSKPQDAAAITANALVTPDRRGHNSRDAAQDRIIVALLDRRALRLQAELQRERSVGEAWYRRGAAELEAIWQTLQGWMSGKQAARLVSQDKRLAGLVRVGTAESAVMPPWMMGEVIEIVGPGVLQQTIAEARRRDARPEAEAYYDAFAAEAAWRRGEHPLASKLTRRAIAHLGRGEALLRARLLAIAAASAVQNGRWRAATQAYAQAMQIDPGVIRRLEQRIPVRLQASGTWSAPVITALQRSPRLLLRDHGAALSLTVSTGSRWGKLCLRQGDGAEIHCSEQSVKADASPKKQAAKLVATFHEELFAPRIDLSQAKIHSLDGSNRVARDPLDALQTAVP